MAFRFKKTIFLALLLCGIAHSQNLARVTIVRDSRQLRFGFEPTRTSFMILLESGKKIAIKILTGKGEGVLAADLKSSERIRSKYLESLKRDCPDCKLVEVRESHGDLSYKIIYPDGYYIQSSLDAGALEWQNEPVIIPDLRENLPVFQSDIFDRGQKAGASLLLEALGGHSTVSGFGNDTFWYGNYLKFRTHNTDLDWGFFGKDGYNATPVRLWAMDQQKKYALVHLEHDKKWEKFLKKLKSTLQDNRATDEHLMKIFQDREVMTMEEYSSRLLNIYHNPKQESKLLGKRSKPKYVANKPAPHMIENRAIRPQKEAKDLLNMAEFIEAEVWYVKEQMSQGYGVEFVPGTFTAKSAANAAREARKIIEDLGLDWKEYERFSTAGSVELTGVEKGITHDFVKNRWGAATRDELFLQLRDRFLAKPNLTKTELIFLSELVNEMGYTIAQAKEGMTLLAQKISPSRFQVFTESEANQVMRNINQINQKFPAAADEISASMQEQMKDYVVRAITEPKMTEARTALSFLSEPSKDQVLEAIHRAHDVHADNVLNRLTLHADLILSSPVSVSEIQNYFDAVSSYLYRGHVPALPVRLNEVLAMADEVPEVKSASSYTATRIADWVVKRENQHMSLYETDPYLLQDLAKRMPQRAERILKPLQNHYLSLVEKSQFGRTNYYQAYSSIDQLIQIVPEKEKPALFEYLLKNVREAHQLKNDDDSKIILDIVEKEYKRVSRRPNVIDLCRSILKEWR